MEVGYEGALYVEVAKTYNEMYCCISDKKFQAFRKLDSHVPTDQSNIADLAVEFDILEGECECKSVKFTQTELKKIMKLSKFSEAPFFFSVTIEGRVYMFASALEEERVGWIRYIRNILKNERKAGAWVSTRLMDENAPLEAMNRFTNTSDSAALPSQRTGAKLEKPADKGRRRSSIRKSKMFETKPVEEDTGDANEQSDALQVLGIDIEEDGDEESDGFCQQDSILGLKTETIVRLMKVCIAFPFIIVVSSLNLSNNYQFLRSVVGIRTMNILIYVAPVVYVRFVLSQFNSLSVQRVAIGFYILLYLFPVAYVVFSKVKVSSSTSKIEEGTFCFKPARVVRVTQANFYALFGFVMEWIQHILYVLPLGIVAGEEATKLSDFPPYLPFEFYFWASVASTFICGLIIILNAVLKGKLHYKFQNSYVVWFFVFNVGSPMFVTIVTILFMSLWCDFGNDPASLIQDPNIQCYGDKHIVMARAGLTAFAIYIIQHTLLPSGTFKETMRDNDLEIMFVPVYLQAHYLLKAIFCGVYVYFYHDNFVRVIALTLINMCLLGLNNYMKPCSVSWVNLLRDGFFVHATLSGIISLNYLAFPENSSTKGMVISTLASTVLFSTVGLYGYYKYTLRSTEYAIASSFLDLEWQVSRGGSVVHPRVLEPLISLTLSGDESDKEIAKKYIGQLVWLISYPNLRVQFQSAWGLANLALLDADAREKIHNANGTKTLFEWYIEMEVIVQLEMLAAMANLSLSMNVADDMVSRFKCIPFFIELVNSNKMKHAQFSAIALANLARKEQYREMIRKHGGIQALVGCILSHDYQKRRHGSRALANMALSPTIEIQQVFESKGLIDRILKMALRKEVETQMEVVALIRNLSCHARLRPILLDRGIMAAVEASKVSVFAEVREWCTDITAILQREISDGAIDEETLKHKDPKAIRKADLELLENMKALEGRVEWSTWGSKLESIFDSVFSTVPKLMSSNVTTTVNTPTSIHLPVGIGKKELTRWRDSLSYVVTEKPTHGKLSEYSTYHDHVTVAIYDVGFTGADFFTYRMHVGAMVTLPATVAITVIDENHFSADATKMDGDDDEAPPSPFTFLSPFTAKKHKAKEKPEPADDSFDIEMIYSGEEKAENFLNPQTQSGSKGKSGKDGPPMWSI